MKCLTRNLEVNYPCSPACPLFGDCVVAFQNEKKKRVRTNADRIRAMSDEELADLIEKFAYSGETPWCDAFDKEFCDNCPTMEIKVEGYSDLLRLHECDFEDGKCPHGGDIKWWLQQPAEEDEK